MMKQDETFQQRWEFRRREVDEDSSSDDNGSNSSGEQEDRKLKLVVLLENDDASDAQGSARHDKFDISNSVDSQAVKADGKKIKSIKKKNVVQKKSERRLVKEIKRKRKLNNKEIVMLKDLKIFADSLVHELTVARENMFARMREEMRQLLGSRSKLEPTEKNVRRSRKKKVCPQNGIETGLKPQNCSGGSTHGNVESNILSDAHKFPKAVAEATKHNQVLEPTTTNEPHKVDRLRLSAMFRMNFAYGSDQVVSSSHFPLPTLLPKPQFENQRNSIHLNDHIPLGVPMNNSGSEIEIGKLMTAKIFSQRFELQQEEQFGGSSHSCHKGVSLLRQNSSRTAIQRIGFPVPLNQGTDNSSTMSSLTYCENSFTDNNVVGLRMNSSNARFPGRSPASSQRMFPNTTISNMPHKMDGEIVPMRLQDLKDGQFYQTSPRNEQ